MIKKDKNHIEDLLPAYFSGDLSKDGQLLVEHWKNESEVNLKQFNDEFKIWESGELLGLMHQFNAKKALEKINKRLEYYKKPVSLLEYLQKIAAVLLIPLIVYSAVVTIGQINKSSIKSKSPIWQEVKTSTGMHSKLQLPDGTMVWLNSETVLEYPLYFENLREVNLKGEAFFEVIKDEKHPFIVNTGKINVEVLGTSFNLTNYNSDANTEIVLKSGRVNLFTGNYERKEDIGGLLPNQRAVYNPSSNKLLINNVSVEKYTAWKEGILMFVDDPMDEVVKKLNRWYNVDIVLEDKELHEYIYRATFRDETLTQILDLLKLSAPIKYSYEPRELLPDGNYSKSKVIIKRR